MTLSELVPAAHVERLRDLAQALPPSDREVVDRLAVPEQVLQVAVPLRDADGRLLLVPCIRIRHSTLLGPAKGGIRLGAEVTPAEIGQLAIEMTVKCALLELPFGGAKGGVVLAENAVSDADRRLLFRRLGARLADRIGPDVDIPAPDVHTGPQDMGALLTGWQQATGQRTSHVVTGKPEARAGLAARHGATGHGAAVVLARVLEARDTSLSRARVAVQGFGSAGRAFAEAVVERGGTVVAVSDSSGTVHDPDGLDLASIARHKRDGGRLADLDGADDAEALFEVPCTVFVPAALGGAITGESAGRLEADLVLEIANGATTPEGDAALADRQIPVVPDVLANAGGVAVSHAEWAAGREGRDPDSDDVLADVDARMCARADAVLDTDGSWRDHAWTLALTRLAEAYRSRRV